jgi:3-hydroxyisobutyrate dehydrogenase
VIVAVLGTGIMGAPMARNLAGAGHAVRAWNRTSEKAEPLTGDGVEVAGSPAGAADGADVVMTMLSDADAVAETMGGPGGALGTMGDDAVWAQTSTIGIAGTERCQAMADDRGVTLVDAPVLGTKEPAEQAQLIVLASGSNAALERCAPLFRAVGQRTVELGEAGSGTRLKMVLNHWILGLVETLAETAALADGLDVEPRTFLETIAGGPLDSPYAQMKGKMIVERQFPPSFTLDLAHKDAELVLEAADRHELDLPLIGVVAERLARGVDAGHAHEDMSATYITSAPTRNG